MNQPPVVKPAAPITAETVPPVVARPVKRVDESKPVGQRVDSYKKVEPILEIAKVIDDKSLSVLGKIAWICVWIVLLGAAIAIKFAF